MEHGEMVNELTISFKDGVMTGVQVRDADGIARGLKAGDLAAQLATVNESALMCADELVALKTELTAYKAQGVQAAQAVVAVVDNPNISDAQTAVTCKAIALEILKNKKERDIEAADKAAAEANAIAASAAAYAAALRAA